MRAPRLLLLAPLLTLASASASAATPAAGSYFVDGFHGGIYGHYPVDSYTQFMVDQLIANPDWRIGLEIEPETWDTVRVRTPEAYEAFAEMMKSGRMEYTNPTYAQPYCYNISGESLIRQFRYGIARLRSHFPGITLSTYAAEEPCFTSCLPAILKGFGFKYASLKCPNTCWGGYMAPFGGQLVNWIGPDGTAILAVPRYACEALEDNSVWQTTAWGNSPAYIEACRNAGIANPVGMTYQDAGWLHGPWLRSRHAQSTYTLWTDYIDGIADHSAATDHRATQDDVRVNLMWGAQVLQRIARQVRRAETRLVMAEKMFAIAMLDGPAAATPNQARIDEAWRQLMLAQHHDSWIVPYNHLWHFGTWADAIEGWTGFATAVADSEMGRAAEAIAAGDSLMVKVFNTQASERCEPVAVALPEGWPDGDGGAAAVELIDHRQQRIPAWIITEEETPTTHKVKRLLHFKATVPPLGYSTYRLLAAGHSDPVAAPAAAAGGDEAAVENDQLRLVVDLRRGGAIKSLFHKGERFDYADPTAAIAMGEIRGHFYDEGRFRSSVETPARVVATTATPWQQSLTVEGEIAGSTFQLVYTLADGSARIDCELTIFWQGSPRIGEYCERNWHQDRRAFCDDRYKLCILFPTACGQSVLTKDAPFDVCVSRNADTFFSRWSEIKHNVVLNWVDVSDPAMGKGFGLVSDHTTSYVHGAGHPLGLTLQYAGQGLWGRDYAVDRPTRVRFALVPHGADGVAAMERAADSFNEPLMAFVGMGDGRPAARSLCRIDGDGYRISHAANADGVLALRLYNSHAHAPAEAVVALPEAAVSATDFMGENPVPVAATPRRASTAVAVDIAPHALLNLAIAPAARKGIAAGTTNVQQ